MKLNEIKDNPGSSKARIRVGRGIGSGKGKQAGRGGKGQTARSGVRIKGFEGGQMPLHRRLPKRGFTPPAQTVYNEVNLGRIQAAIDAGKLNAAETITVESLVKAGVVTHARDGVKILGSGELKAKANFEVATASKSAAAAIEKAGGCLKTLRAEAQSAPE
jgi:large subunit ribosomal protein L15